MERRLRRLRWLAPAIVACGAALSPAPGEALHPATRLYLPHDGVPQQRVADGLPSNDVRWLSRAPDGTVYVATAAGFGRLTGTRFEELAPERESVDRMVRVIDASTPGRAGRPTAGRRGPRPGRCRRRLRGLRVPSAFRTFDASDGFPAAADRALYAAKHGGKARAAVVE